MRDGTATRRALRAGLVVIVAAAGGLLLWRLRPSAHPAGIGPDADIVLGCAWLAWLLAGYLALAVAASAATHLLARAGTVAALLGRLAPARLRRLVDATVTVGLAATIASSVAAPASASPAQLGGERAPTVAGSPLDWPGLVVSAPANHPHHHAARHVVVRPGDSLWRIAARRLGPGASAARITAAWHAWYAANRAEIGPDPALIRPGQRLVPPAEPGGGR